MPCAESCILTGELVSMEFAMQIIFRCPTCQQHAWSDACEPGHSLQCVACGWMREIERANLDGGKPSQCLICGCDDLWRQKDFPQTVGVVIVGLGALLSTIAWAYWRPVLAIAILMLCALADLLLYTLMNDVLVCYRCGSRHRYTSAIDKHPWFDLETAERYRQEAKRLERSLLSGGANDVERGPPH